MAKGLLFASFNTSPAQEDEFNDWYDTEHVPERMRVPGFLNPQRWSGDEHPTIARAPRGERENAAAFLRTPGVALQEIRPEGLTYAQAIPSSGVGSGGIRRIG